MIETLISLLILCIVFGLLLYAVRLLPLPAPFNTVALIVLILIFVLVLLGGFVGSIPIFKCR